MSDSKKGVWARIADGKLAGVHANNSLVPALSRTITLYFALSCYILLHLELHPDARSGALRHSHL